MAAALSTVQTSAPQGAAPQRVGADSKVGADLKVGSAPTDIKAVLDRYCVTCHSERIHTAGLVLEGIDVANPAAHAEVWERVITRLHARSMPPAGVPRPDVATYDAMSAALEAAIDRVWAANPNPGRIAAVHRLNRVEYNNAIRDLFALDIDVTSKLPGDLSLIHI